MAESIRTTVVEILRGTFSSGGSCTTERLAHELQCELQVVVGALKSLTSVNSVTLDPYEKETLKVTSEGQECVEQGTPEGRLVALLRSSGPLDLTVANESLGDVSKVALAQAMQGKLVSLDKASGKLSVLVDQSWSDPVQSKLRLVVSKGEGATTVLPASDLDALRKRKLVVKGSVTHYKVSPINGSVADFETALKAFDAVADMTAEMVTSGSYRDGVVFKPVNLNSKGKENSGGYLHPLMKVASEIKRILLSMGFSEMNTQRFVESSFWNFDALFQPQQHPARDAHDTFFVGKKPDEGNASCYTTGSCSTTTTHSATATHPATATCSGAASCPSVQANSEIPNGQVTPAALVDKVQKAHEGFLDLKSQKDLHIKIGESLGWRYEWSIDEARKNILRTHTTAVTARTLYEIASEFKKLPAGSPWKPIKRFSVDRVFRNETVDATHLAEFHQVEGFVAAEGLTLCHLMGVIGEFFNRLGLSGVKFKPAYNPYTEPSMEIFAFHPRLNRWIEIGNSGIFRPEMLKPLGLPDNVSVIAWGLSVERPTMIQFDIANIRDLFGHKMDITTCKTAPICWFQDK